MTLRDEIDRLNADPAFQPGTLSVVTVPAGADASNTNATGGASGTGVLDVRNLTLAASGGTAVIEFEVTLAPVIANGTDVLNQSQLLARGHGHRAIATTRTSTVPLTRMSPATRTRRGSASCPRRAFRCRRSRTDMTGDPAILLAGETLRYTITVKNIGNADATDVEPARPDPGQHDLRGGQHDTERRAGARTPTARRRSSRAC